MWVKKQAKTRCFVFFNGFLLEDIGKKPFLHQKFFLPFNIDCEDCF